jgi:glutamine phosphoribosylpyrophosphate amidotransferase
VFALYVGGYFLGRLWVESLRVDPASIVLGLRVNIWISIIVVVAVASVIAVRGLRRRPDDAESLYLDGHVVAVGHADDTEVAAGYMMWRQREGDSMQAMMDHAFEDLDGFYTFLIGTRDGFAVVRDPIACKPAVIAETDEWVAMASEYRSIATLPGAETAKTWEPAPATIYAWEKEAVR